MDDRPHSPGNLLSIPTAQTPTDSLRLFQRTQFEAVARAEYTKTDEKNPVDCTLHYLALRKPQVLRGLWRMASWHREQAGTQRLLANNFADARWRSAALKNAYALLGKRRYGTSSSSCCGRVVVGDEIFD